VYFEGNLCRVENKFLTKLNLRINKLKKFVVSFAIVVAEKASGAFESSS
jgi:hypothetical protein